MKKNLLKKVLLNAVLGGALLLPNFWATGAEAAEISGNMSADAITEDSTVVALLFLNSGVLNYTLTNNSRVYFEGATTMNAAVNGGLIFFEKNIIVTDAEYINGDYNIISAADCTVTLQGGTLIKKVEGVGNLDFAGDVSTNAGYIATTGTITVESDKTLTFIGGTLAQKVQGEGNLNFAGDVSTNANNIATTGTNTVASGVTLTLNSGILTKGIANNGIVKLAGATLGGNNLVTTGTLEFAQSATYDASFVSAENNIVDSGVTLTLNAGTLTKKVQGAGNLDFATDMTVNADNIANTGTNTVESGKTIKFDSGTITQTWNGAGNLDFATDMTVNADNIANTGTNTVESGAKLTFIGGTLTKNITGDGTTEFNNTVSVADGVNLGTATNNVNGTLNAAGNIIVNNINVNGMLNAAGNITANNIDVNGTLDVMEHITASNINFKNDSTLKVDGRKITGTAAINGITSANVESGAKLYVSNAVKNTPYKILAGSGISVSGWQTDAEMGDGFRGMYGLIVDTDSITNNSNEFIIQFKAAFSEQSNVDVPNLLENTIVGSKLYKFVDNISQANPYKSTQATVINTMANMNSLANVQQSTYTVSNMAADSIHHNIDVFQRPILVGHKGQGIGHKAEGIGHRVEGIGHRAEGVRNREESIREREEGLRNVFANDKDTAEIKTVEQGESGNIMPAKATTEPQTYNKEVWANYIHSKRTIDGMKTGKFLQQDSTSQYNGITAGIDLWSSTHGFGGIALTAADGKTNANQKASSIKNETEYKGISVYNRYDTKNTAILTDFTYTHSDHDIKMRTAGTEDITAKPKADAYSIGVKIEQPIATSKNSEIAPYIGARYTNIHTKNYKTSLDLQYDIDSQNIFNIPIGIAWRNQNQIENGWKIGEVVETGYMWNIGDRDSTQHLSYGGINDNIGFAMADKGEYFARMAIQAIHKDTDFEVGYKYTKGDTVKDSQWNFNVNHSFGNANGMPYKSVLLGKIDLLEAANKDLRTENNGLKTENVELNNQVKDLQAENGRKDLEIARLKQLLASKGI